jgi:hypothetical protein
MNINDLQSIREKQGAAVNNAPKKEENINEDLVAEIEDSQVECLNEAKDHNVKHLILNSKSKNISFSTYLESSDDDQLLIYIPFKNKVHIRSVQFFAPDDESCPKTIKIFANKPGMDFDDANDSPATETIELKSADAANKAAKPTPVKITKFRNVSSLTIFVENNHGGDTSKLVAIKLIGTTTEGMNMNELKKQNYEE